MTAAAAIGRAVEWLREPAVRRRLELAVIAVLSVAGVALTVRLFQYGLTFGQPGFDALCYWHFDPAHPYIGTYGELFFSYAPPVAIAFLPGHLLSFDAFRAVWLVIQLGGLAYIGRRYTLVLLLFLPVGVELFNGNIHLLLAAAIVAGFRYPAAWSLVLLTKLTPGVGLLWFAVRREWRNLAIALGATAAISLVTVAIVPDMWRGWIEFLLTNPTPAGQGNFIPIPLPVRVLAAALLVIYGARTERRWTVPAAAMISLPIFWINGLAMLVAVVPLWKLDMESLRQAKARAKARAAEATSSASEAAA